MRRQIAILCAALLALALAAAPARADFGLHDLGLVFEDEQSPTQAGSHPDSAAFSIAVNTTESEGIEIPDEALRDILVEFPPGLLADPYAVPRCSAADFAAGEGVTECPDSAALGYFDLVFGFGEPGLLTVPLYSLAPPPGVVARVGFKPVGVPVTVDFTVAQDPPYNASAASRNTAQAAFFYSGNLVLWGNPSAPAHDKERGFCVSSEAEDSCPVSLPERPFHVLPRSCRGPLSFDVRARSWPKPESWLSYGIQTDPTGGCAKLGFAPEIEARPSTSRASSPSGLAFDLAIDNPGLQNPDGVSDSDIEKTVVTLPEGMTVNPSQAEGLAACSEAQLDRETAASEPGEGCPEAAKIGSVEVETPLLEGKLLKGGLYVAEPHENRFGSLIALYMTIKEPDLGLSFNLAGEVEPDPASGQLITTFEDLPQAPFSSFRLRFREGGRSPLITPPRCGTYAIEALFTPWSDPGGSFSSRSDFEIEQGPGGGPCPPGGTPPFEPGFEAGSLNNAAAAYSPFAMRLTRRDGDQDLTRFDAVLPPGVVGRVAGAGRCPDAQIAAAKAKSGLAERRSPSCPPDSKVGTVQAGAGVGSQLTYVPGSIYLAGPFAGAPLSVVAIVPAVAGPFDVGTVVTRQALRIDPRSAQVTVDGAASDPIPHILAGIPLAVRDIQVGVDRPAFTLNPTGCERAATSAAIWGGGADLFSSADDLPVARQAPYQAAGCEALGFGPRLGIRLRGGTRRGAHPALRAVVTPRPGQANFSRAVVKLPRSAFLDQGHIRTICTRVQFAAGPGHGAACPPGARYGYARAWSPLLDAPAQGPVFLRSSDNKLPDLVVALRGPASAPIEVELAARIDSVRGGIRSTFPAIPDVPVSRFVLAMQGGKKGLIVNSRELCRGKSRALARLAAHNGKRRTLRPRVRPRCKRRGAVRAAVSLAGEAGR